MEQQQRRGRSSSRSPTLNRRPSLKEKAGTSSGISKTKKKQITSVKKERWLLTRKTWRYMTDAVGNLLPEHVTNKSGSGSGTESRRPSSALTLIPILSEDSHSGHSPSGAESWVGTGTTSQSPTAFWTEGVGGASSGEYKSEVLLSQGGGEIIGRDYRTLTTGSGAARCVSHHGQRSPIPQDGTATAAATAAATACASANFTVMPPQSVARSSICGGSGHIEDPAMADIIPKLEKNFEQACNKEKKFLLWTRTRPKGLSGPALRDLKLKEKGRRGSKKGSQESEEGDLMAGTSRTRNPSSASTKHFCGRDSGPDNRENLMEYYSPDEDMMDDDYDEYGQDEEPATVKDRRKSSAASSILSLVSGGLSFFRPLGQTISAFATSSPAGVAPDGQSFARTIPGSGIIRYFRHAGIQTEPFPEEILIRLRLQSVQEEQLMQQQHIIHGRYGRESDLPVEEQPSQLHHILIPIDRSVAGMSIVTTSQSPHHVLGGPSPTRESKESARSSADMEPKGDKSGGSKSPTSTEVIADQTDKKSEESGYSSSISDTVMRYLRMARKNSKADNKETIDKFKTVNYDRSLRYIKSKNVTVEEALEHERNKALAAQNKALGADQPPVSPVLPESSPVTIPETITSLTKPVPPSSLAIFGSKSTSSKPTTTKAKKSGKISGKSSKKQSPATSPTSPVETPGDTSATADGTAIGGFPGPASPTGVTDSTPTNSASVEPSSPQSPTSPTAIGTRTTISTSLPASQVQTPAAPASSLQASPTIPVPPPPPPASIGIQAGESLIRFLRNFNPARKFSDFSSAASYGSSESPPVEVTSPRYSISTTVLSSSSDNELYQQQMLRQEFQHHHTHPNLPAYFGGTGTGRSSLVDSSTSYSGADSGEFEDQIYSPGSGGQQKRHSSSISTSFTTAAAAYGSPLSTTTTTTTTMILKKSSSSQQIQKSASRDPRDPALGALYLHHILPATRSGGLGGGVSSLSVSSSPGTLTSLSAPHVNVSSLSGSVPYIIPSKGSPSLSASSIRSDYPQYTPRTTSISITTPVSMTTSPGGSSHRSGFNFLSSFRSSTKRHSGSSQKPEKPHSSSSTSISSFLRRTSSGSTKQTTASSGTTGTGTAAPSVSFKESLLGYGHEGSSGGKRDSEGGSGSGIGIGGIGSSSREPYDTSQLAGSSSRNMDSASSLVMQKSKSSSSVLHQHHGQNSSEKRGSACSATGGGILSSQTAAAASRLISKSRIFKSRSKSQTRGSGGGGSCTWTPQGKCKWTNVSGKQVTVESTTVLHLSETERMTLQKVALAKLQALNLGVDVKIPREKVASATKPKRRPYLLKKKALSTGFFDSGTKQGDTKEGGGSGLVFGIPLSQCVTNDQQRRALTAGASTVSSPGPPDWEQNSGTHKRSQNGSRNSVSSVCEASIYNKGDIKAGSTESLVWGKRESCAALDSLSCSSGDILGENMHIVSASVPVIVTSCIQHLEMYGLHTTGIFRVSTSLKRIRQLREEIDGGKDVQFGEEQNPHDVAALLKEFLRDLPEPLLCRDLYQAFLRTQKIRNRRLQMEAVQHLIQLLPVPNRDTLAALLKLFAKVVENAADTRTRTGEVLMGNKMEAYSLATLIAPNILPCIPTEGSTTMDQTATQTKERRESIDVVTYMISNYKELFEVAAELLDEVYIHMMDTHPEVIEDILKQKAGICDDAGLDELETTSSVFEGSECGDPVEGEEPTVITSFRKFQKREEILHKDGGKGGQPDSNRNRCGRDGSKERSADLDKQQSGAESDSSSTKSTSRWFRRGTKSDHKSRTSSDSGSEKVRGKGKREQSFHDTKRANSLDSVNLKEMGSTSATVIVAETLVERQSSSSDQSLKVPDNVSRRQSSPVLEGTGIITASLSLKIPVPVPHSIDDSDIPFIEDDNNGEAITSQRIGQYQTSTTTRPTRTRAAYTDASTFTRTTPISTHTSTPLSSPLRPPTEVSVPTVFSPPNSPPCDDSNTFPYEELTLRFCLGPPLTNTSGGIQSQQHSPHLATSKSATTVLASSSSTVFQPSTSGSKRMSSPQVKSIKPEVQEIAAQETELKDIPSDSDTKGLNKDAGAKIAGLIKSKTADFEKFAKDSRVGQSAIASNMRLRSQGNIQLKQQFLLRQHDKFQQQTTPVRSSSGLVLGPEGLVNSGSRSLQRRKNLPGSASSSAIVGSSGSGSSSSASSEVASSQSQSQSQSKISEKEKPGETKPHSSGYNLPISTGYTAQSSGASAAGNPSRWKRSEIIASQRVRTSSATPSERETFF